MSIGGEVKQNDGFSLANTNCQTKNILLKITILQASTLYWLNILWRTFDLLWQTSHCSVMMRLSSCSIVVLLQCITIKLLINAGSQINAASLINAAQGCHVSNKLRAFGATLSCQEHQPYASYVISYRITSITLYQHSVLPHKSLFF